MLYKSARHGLESKVRSAGIKPYFGSLGPDKPQFPVHDGNTGDIVISARLGGYCERIKSRTAR